MFDSVCNKEERVIVLYLILLVKTTSPLTLRIGANTRPNLAHHQQSRFHVIRPSPDRLNPNPSHLAPRMFQPSTGQALAREIWQSSARKFVHEKKRKTEVHAQRI